MSGRPQDFLLRTLGSVCILQDGFSVLRSRWLLIAAAGPAPSGRGPVLAG